ncbi:MULTISPECIES: hypothetical protein [Rhodococcus]|uniref:hypothetical protein n=1 Tax=Rhodococcus TaxID=1827 RepID=UPI0011AEEDD0|nr:MULTISPECIES: hypothetical protein [Rhodococcus]WKX01889.1 hypothetical protein Q3O43_28005 [Rhodococcus aetherivorans]
MATALFSAGRTPRGRANSRRAHLYDGGVVFLFEVGLVLAAVSIAWFALYVLYRLVTDESNRRRR